MDLEYKLRYKREIYKYVYNFFSYYKFRRLQVPLLQFYHYACCFSLSIVYAGDLREEVSEIETTNSTFSKMQCSQTNKVLIALQLQLLTSMKRTESLIKLHVILEDIFRSGGNLEMQWNREENHRLPMIKQ